MNNRSRTSSWPIILHGIQSLVLRKRLWVRSLPPPPPPPPPLTYIHALVDCMCKIALLRFALVSLGRSRARRAAQTSRACYYNASRWGRSSTAPQNRQHVSITPFMANEETTGCDKRNASADPRLPREPRRVYGRGFAACGLPKRPFSPLITSHHGHAHSCFFHASESPIRLPFPLFFVFSGKNTANLSHATIIVSPMRQLFRNYFPISHKYQGFQSARNANSPGMRY